MLKASFLVARHAPSDVTKLPKGKMLTAEQRELIKQGFSKGVPDPLIAEMVPGLNHMQVYNFRRSLGISAATVLENRYDTWIRMINSGISLDAISDIYKVKPRSIQIVLWRARGFSFVEAKKTAQKVRDHWYKGPVKLKRNNVFDW